MASTLNSIYKGTLDTSHSTGHWEDVKDYTNAIITLLSTVDGSGVIEWADTSGRRIPTDTDIIASQRFLYDTSGTPMTREFDHRARWFRVRYDASGDESDMSINLQTLYKKAPTELKICDGSANVVSVNIGPSGNSLYTALTDSSGALLRTTNATIGNALFVHLSDGSGVSLATTHDTSNNSLFVSLRDSSNHALATTGGSKNALYVRPGDSAGKAQASTYSVSGAASAGVAMYAALADSSGILIDTTATKGYLPADGANALYVTLANYLGDSIDEQNALPVINTVEVTGATAFDISYGVEEQFIHLSADVSSFHSKKANLYNLFAYNDGPTTAWLKVYDVSHGKLATGEFLGPLTNEVAFDASLRAAAIAPVYNITVPAHRYRDLVLPGGATFANGIYVRATKGYHPGSLVSPGENVIFVNGSYSLYTPL